LFLIFINNLPEGLLSKIRSFADDCILYSQIKSINDHQFLQADLDSLARWELMLGIDFHPQKCSIVRVTGAKSPLRTNYILKGITLAEEQTSNY
jgi:hypothetical protein